MKAYDIVWLTRHETIIYADGIEAAVRIAQQRVDKKNGDNLLSVVEKTLPEIGLDVKA